jgi:hypothetical protein
VNDPVGPLELFDAGNGNEILAAAASYSNVFLHLRDVLLSGDELKWRLGVSDRGFVVRMTGLGVFGLNEKRGVEYGLLDQARTFLMRGSSSSTIPLNDEMVGALHMAICSIVPISITEGRAHSAVEYREWLSDVGLVPQEVVPTLVDCPALTAIKPRH